ncbi:MAG: PKD domain-containing protein [Flavobacteriales bacterium]
MQRSFLYAASSLLSFSLSAGSGHDHPPVNSGAVPKTPLVQQEFLENKGHLPAQVLYRADFGPLALFAERDRLTWSMLQSDAGERVHQFQHDKVPFQLNGHAWNMRFVDAEPSLQVHAADRGSASFNFFLGNDPSKWSTDAHAFANVTYHGVWPGIDLVLKTSEGAFKYDVLLDAGADVAKVRFAYSGLKDIEVSKAGRLVMSTSVGELMEMNPVAWYADGAREPLVCHFVLENNEVGFRFDGVVDNARPIVIDPLLMASTLSGTGNLGMTENYGHTATYDLAGNIYTGAICFGQGYPVTPGAFDLIYGGGWTDIAVSKLNPDGSTLIYATYLGGSDGDHPHSLVVTPNNELTVYGTSESFNYPVSAGAFQAANGGGTDIVVSKLTINGGALVGSTYVGGPSSDGQNYFTSNYGDSYRGEVISDANGNILISSCSQGAGFPTTAGAYQPAYGGGAQDGVLFSLNPTLSAMNWSSYLGTTGSEMCFGIKLNSAGEVYVAGGTSSNAFPTTAGVYQPASAGANDGFIAHFSGGASTLVHSTYFGSSMQDVAFFLQLDLDDDVYIYGQSEAGGITISPAGTYGTPGTDIFVAEFSSDLSTNIFKSVVGNALGGFGNSLVPVAFLVDVCEHIYISGYGTYSGGFDTTPGALYTTGGFYLAAYDVDMVGLLYGTYYEGAGHVDGGTSRFDSNGIVYQAVCTSGPFPTTPWAYSNVQPQSWDVGVFKIDFQVAGVNAAGAGTINQGCAPIQIDFLNTSTGDQWIWDFGDGSALDTTYTPSHTYTSPGVYTVVLIAFDSLSCNLADTISFPVTIGQSQVLTASFTAVPNADCTVSQVITTNTSTGSPLAFEWDMGDGTQYTDTNVTHTYLGGPGTYDIELLVYDPTGCSPPDSVTQTIVVLPPDTVHAAFSATQVPDCNNLLVDCINASSGPAPTYLWDMGDGTQYTSTDVNDHLYTATGTYTITLIATDTLACNQADTVTIDVTLDPYAPVVAGFTATQVFDCAQLLLEGTNTSTGSFMAFSWNMGDGTQYTDTNVTHTYTAAGTYDISLVVSDLSGCAPPDTATLSVTVDPIVPVVADFVITQVGNCTLLTVQGTNQSQGDSVSYTWDMGDGTQYFTTDVTHVYTVPGTYTVELVVTDLGCGNDDALSTTVVVINTLPVVAATDGVICPGLSTTIDASGTPGNYLWNNGYTTDSIVVSSAGTYWVTVSDGLCTGSDTVDVIEAPEVELSYGFDACPGSGITLTVPFQGTSYLWETGGTDQSEYLLFPGGDTTDYDFQVWDSYGCVHDDSVTVTPMDSQPQLFAPNAFTPDGDGINDEFVITGYGERDVELLIFNRWGEQIFNSTSLTDPWNGTYNGQIKQDVYVYKLKYNGECTNDETSLMGHVTVVK